MTERDESLDVGKWGFEVADHIHSRRFHAYAWMRGPCDVMQFWSRPIDGPWRESWAEAESDLAMLKTAVADMLSGLKGGPSKAEMIEVLRCCLLTLKHKAVTTAPGHVCGPEGNCDCLCMEAARDEEDIREVSALIARHEAERRNKEGKS